MDADWEHDQITAAGWAFRTNYRGWVIYREPRTGLWHTREQVIRKLNASRKVSRAVLLRSEAKKVPKRRAAEIETRRYSNSGRGDQAGSIAGAPAVQRGTLILKIPLRAKTTP